MSHEDSKEYKLGDSNLHEISIPTESIPLIFQGITSPFFQYPFIFTFKLKEFYSDFGTAMGLYGQLIVQVATKEKNSEEWVPVEDGEFLRSSLQICSLVENDKQITFLQLLEKSADDPSTERCLLLKNERPAGRLPYYKLYKQQGGRQIAVHIFDVLYSTEWDDIGINLTPTQVEKDSKDLPVVIFRKKNIAFPPVVTSRKKNVAFPWWNCIGNTLVVLATNCSFGMDV